MRGPKEQREVAVGDGIVRSEVDVEYIGRRTVEYSRLRS